MHLIMKVKVVNLNLPVCKEESRTEKGLQYCQVRSLSAGSSGFCCMFLARQRRFLLLKLFSVRCGWARREGGGACVRGEKAQKGRAEGGRVGGRMMGQVWNLHTLLVARTIGIFASAWWVTPLAVEVREDVGDTQSEISRNVWPFLALCQNVLLVLSLSVINKKQ